MVIPIKETTLTHDPAAMRGYCDRCCAEAQWVASTLNGPLLFCGHHYMVNRTFLTQVAISIQKYVPNG